MTARIDDLDEDWASGDDLDGDGRDDGDESDASSGSRLPEAARRALTTLLTNRFITRSRNRSAWEALLMYEGGIRERLADMYLLLVIDKDYEVAFKRQDPTDDAPVLLRRDKPLPRDASLLLIHLRKEHTYSDAIDDPVMITRVQVIEFLRAFREEGDGDEARFDRRVDAAIRAVTELRLLTPDPDANYLFTVSPAIVPLIGADEMIRMESYFVQATNGSATAAADPDDDAAGGETE